MKQPCHIFALPKTCLKNNEKVNIQHYTWVELNRQNKEGGGIYRIFNKKVYYKIMQYSTKLK